MSAPKATIVGGGPVASLRCPYCNGLDTLVFRFKSELPMSNLNAVTKVVSIKRDDGPRVDGIHCKECHEEVALPDGVLRIPVIHE